MTPSTDTLPAESGTAAQEGPSPPQGRPRSRARRAVLAPAAIVAACVAAAALALVVRSDGGGDTDLPATRPAPHADQVDHEAHLVGQARTHGGGNDTTNDRQPGEPSTDDFLPGSRRVPIR
jgi:hypothetical protein